MICAHCGEATEPVPCGSCGEEPRALGRWQLTDEIGRGASATTFRATDEVGRVVAIKEMPLGRVSSGKERELLDREVRVLAELDHPGIPAFYESAVQGEGAGRVLMLVQEFIEGIDLQSELQQHRYSVTEVLVVMDGLLDVLTYLHGLSPPVVHRDVKPANVMRRPNGAIVLLDYGAVRDSVRELGGSTVAGTFGYMAPEQLIGDASPVSDLYALGALAVQLLSRVDPQQMLSVSRGLDWEPHVDVPAGVRELLRDLLQPDPDVRRKRLVSTTVVRGRVQALCLDPEGPAPEPAPLVPVEAASTTPAQAPAAPLAALLAGVVLCCVLAGAVFSLVLVSDDAEVAVEAVRAVEPMPVVEAPIAVPAELPAELEPAEPPPEILDVWVGDLPQRGALDAPVQIVVFTDLQCPFCARLSTTLDEVVAEHEGVVSVWFRDFPLDFHRQARGAHIATRCADQQGAFWALHDRLFAFQKQLEPSDLVEHASVVGLDVSAFRRCIEADHDDMVGLIERDIVHGKELGVRGTPASFVNGELLSGAQPKRTFDEAIDAALQRLDSHD